MQPLEGLAVEGETNGISLAKPAGGGDAEGWVILHPLTEVTAPGYPPSALPGISPPRGEIV
ncbi:hypothetical protein, partial [Nitratireductor aquibiodomus]|uniref:hypothetical protein n=1 Tax=Nitratireductor aquibiodomus TaxID=204799 RepID=UPI001FCB4F69